MFDAASHSWPFYPPGHVSLDRACNPSVNRCTNWGHGSRLQPLESCQIYGGFDIFQCHQDIEVLSIRD